MRYETEITQRSVLEEALYDHEAIMSRYSKHGRKLEPLRGYESEFDIEQKKCDILRKMIRALESEGVRRAMAQWQVEEMSGEKQTGLFTREAEDGYPETDGVDYTERWRISGGGGSFIRGS